MEINKKLIGTALAVVLLLGAIMANSGELGLPEFVAFLAGTGALGVISSLAIAAIRIAVPEIDSDYAVFFSMAVAVVFNGSPLSTDSHTFRAHVLSIHGPIHHFYIGIVTF